MKSYGILILSMAVLPLYASVNYNYKAQQANKKLEKEACFSQKINLCKSSVCQNQDSQESEDPDCEENCKKQAKEACQ